MGILDRWFSKKSGDNSQPGEETRPTSEAGLRATPEEITRRIYAQMQIDYGLRATILDIRHMDRSDGQVKRIHRKVARDTVKGGIVLQQADANETIAKEWKSFQRRLQLDRVEKLKSDAQGLVMEGNVPFQMVIDDQRNVVAMVRMPTETIRANVGANGRFIDPTQAYIQFDMLAGKEIARFALWQMLLLRFDPDNFDDYGCMGRPFLDANRSTWRKLNMANEDLVIRRRMRAPLRMAHILENASADDLNNYRATVEKDQAHGAVTDYYLNKKGSVNALQGDANLDQIGDIAYLLDTFFSGAPMPKGLMGHIDGMARDILEDLKRDYYDEIDVLQDTLAYGYAQAFRLQLLLRGLNPDDFDYTISFAERRTETLSQTTDRALKLKSIGMPEGMVWEELGLNAAQVQKRREWERKNLDPYPNEDPIPTSQVVKVTPGNGRKGESGTSIAQH
ncbi:portal protein [Deefgea piscis]|uniref:portal protein n=1 Tax=Deefgea piscis TaxID=2739061 RepID=UPI001C81605B|nr:portal protein [Deefgea piscis]QZA80842.1 portal protein [Deefgea piscis]